MKKDRLKQPFNFFIEIWSGKRDSNPRPLPWQGNALPTELFPHNNTIILASRSNLSNIYANYSDFFFQTFITYQTKN